MKRIRTLFIVLLSWTMLSCGGNVKFDSEKWKSGNAKIKGEMIDNILNDSLLIGKNETELIQMLGKPDQQKINQLNYIVDPGIEFLSEPWTYWLSVEIDTVSGKVKDVWVTD